MEKLLLDALTELHEATCEIENPGVKLSDAFIKKIVEANKKALAVIQSANQN